MTSYHLNKKIKKMTEMKKKIIKLLGIWIAWLGIAACISHMMDQALNPILHNHTGKLCFLILQVAYVIFFVDCLTTPKSSIKEIKMCAITNEIVIPKSAGNGQHGNARFATNEEWKRMTDVYVTGERGGSKGCGLVLEMTKKRGKEVIRYIGGEQHSIILGSTGAGKTRRILLETIYLQILAGWSVVVSDVKGEIYYYTSDFARKKNCKVITLDLRNPNKSMRYNYLQPILNALKEGDQSKAVDYTWDLVSVLVGEAKGEPLWYNGETATIAAAILCVALEAPENCRNLTNVYYFLSYMCQMDPQTGSTPLGYYLKTLPQQHPARTIFSIAEVAAPRTRSSFYTSALGTLRLFTNPNIAAMTAQSDYELSDIGKEQTILYMIVPDEKKTLYPLVSLMIQQLYIAQVETANDNGLTLPVQTDYDLDEIANFPTIPVLENMASAGRSRGIRINLVLQDYQQLQTRYKESCETIKTCCQIKVLLKTDNPQTLKEIKEGLGNYTTESISASTSINTGHRADANVSSSSNLSGRALLETEELQIIKSPYALVMITGEHPYISNLPDLSKYRMNRYLGLGDKKHNQKLITEREAQRKARSSDKLIPLWGIWDRYTMILEKDAEQKISFLK